MFSKRSFTTSVLIAAIGLGAGAAIMSPSDASAKNSDPCKGKKFALNEVKEACGPAGTKGGEGKAKEVMKRYKKAIEDKGDKKKADCKACHKGSDFHEINGTEFTDRAKAVDFLKKMASAK